MKPSPKPIQSSIRDSEDSPLTATPTPPNHLKNPLPAFPTPPPPGSSESLSFAAAKLSQSRCYRYWCYFQISITFAVLCFILYDMKTHWDYKLVEILMHMLVCCIIIDIIWNCIIHGIKKLIFQYWFILDVLSLVIFGGCVLYMA